MKRNVPYAIRKRAEFCLPNAERKCAHCFLRAIAWLAAQVLSDTDTQNRIGAVYIAKVKNVLKNINACFVEIAEKETCFLSLKDATAPILLNRTYDGRILEGDEILVQITREAQKGKQASVTADISLADEYAAVGLGSKHIGYSGKIGNARKEELKEWLSEAGLMNKGNFVQNTSDSSIGMVVRTGAKECKKDVLLQSIEARLNDLCALIETAKHRTCFTCVKEAQEEFCAVLNQLAYSSEYSEIVTDDISFYEKLKKYCAEKMPDKSVRLYEDASFSLSALYSLEAKLDTALGTRVWLKSGAYLVIEPTEALTVIDVNTGKCELKKNAWETYEQINREAAQEIALQMRLRNLSGIILVDFINMENSENDASLIEYVRTQVNKDRIKTNVVDITELGLMEITRKKTNKPLREQFNV